ncbi:MAG TPA: MerR family transcriptional regulator, partial [Geminicoccaceae bacterium]|nr:MerR family transcriptional regulator [Geminicoccaceae bacterium]
RAPAMTIGRLSARAGCRVETVRYYERIGLLRPPPRTEGGHRLYDRDHLKRLTFVRRSRALGFTLGEVRTLLGLADGDGAGACGGVRAVALDHLARVRRQIAELRRLERALADAAALCAGDTAAAAGCPLVERLYDDPPPHQAPPRASTSRAASCSGRRRG